MSYKYKLNKFSTLCQEDDVVDIDINLEPTEGEEAEAVEAEIEANEDVAEIADAEDQLENAEIAADEVEEKIEEGEAVVAVSEPAVDNGGDVPADVVVTTDSGKELTPEEVAEAVEKLNEAGEVASDVVMEQEHFIQKIELITGLSRKGDKITREAARRESTVSYKMNIEGLKEMGASIANFIKSIIKWIKDKIMLVIEKIAKYLPTKMGKLKRFADKVNASEKATFELDPKTAELIAAFNLFKLDGKMGYFNVTIDLPADKAFVPTGIKVENGEFIGSGYVISKDDKAKLDANAKDLKILDVETKEVTHKLTVDKAISKSTLIKLVGDVIETANKLNSYNGPFIKVKTAIIDGLLKRKEENEKEFVGVRNVAKVARGQISYAAKVSLFITSTLVNAVATIKLDDAAKTAE